MTAFPPEEFWGATAFITGASSGIGRETALAFARAGANIVVADVDPEASEETAALVRALGTGALLTHCDVTDEAAVIAAMDAAVDEFGGIDFAVNNAGIGQSLKPLAELTAPEWDQVIAVNLRGVFLGMKYQIPTMLERGGGAIVNVSSGAGVRGIRGRAAYVASKHAVVGLTKAAALDYAGQGVRINCVCPGMMDSPMGPGWTENAEVLRAQAAAALPIGRLGGRREVAEAVLFLCSPAASYLAGHALVVDGGQTL